MSSLLELTFDNRYQALSSSLQSSVMPKPLSGGSKSIIHSEDCSALLNIEYDADLWCQCFSGKQLVDGMQPIAQKYTGHQFGTYNPELGDGRGLLLGEVINSSGERLDLHLKGAGQTPFSRMGDGRAVLRSTIREFLVSEAMFSLGIPTTRALCITASDEPVFRDEKETAATLCRVAGTHIRFGHFEYLYHSQQHQLLEEFADFVIELYFNELSDEKDKYSLLFKNIIQRTAVMIAHWQAVGFCHGVMNTDNFSILGDTFDYGPYQFMDAFNPGHISNSSDWQGRYAFNRQIQVGLWNLNCLAQAFIPLIPQSDLVSSLQQYEPHFLQTYAELMSKKLGLNNHTEDDHHLIGELLSLMASQGSDYTRTFRALCDTDSRSSAAEDEFSDRDAFRQWLRQYQSRRQQDDNDFDAGRKIMLQHNPCYVLRNYLAQEVIDAAQQGNFQPLHELHQLLRYPYDQQPDKARFSALPPDWSASMSVSCSS